MNTISKSKICRFISEHEDWESELSSHYKIAIQKEGNLALFKYQIDADFSDPIVQEARGIIVDIDKLEVVCWPFRKFGNHTESYVDSIDWSTARVQEKIDGSLIKLWYDKSLKKWQFSTNGIIRAEKAIRGKAGVTFYDLIRNAVNYTIIPFDNLDKDKTYLFELVGPDNRIVVSYENTMLYHLGTKDNLTGLECDIDIGITKPLLYPFTSIEQAVQAVCELNTGDEVTHEGFVVVDKNWNRIKIKSLEYFFRHRLLTEKLNKELILSALLNRTISEEEFIKDHPQYEVEIRFYAFKLAELTQLLDNILFLARTLYEEYHHDRKKTAEILKKHPFGHAGFWGIDNNGTVMDYIQTLNAKKICNMVETYQPILIKNLFLSC